MDEPYTYDQEHADHMRDVYQKQASERLEKITGTVAKLYSGKDEKVIEIWGSKYFFVIVSKIFKDNSERLNIHRTDIDVAARRWRGDITWDELMEVKRQCGRGDAFAIEPFPKDKDIINTQNVRHLHIIADEILEKLNLGWVGAKLKEPSAPEDFVVSPSVILTKKLW